MLLNHRILFLACFATMGGLSKASDLMQEIDVRQLKELFAEFENLSQEAKVNPILEESSEKKEPSLVVQQFINDCRIYLIEPGWVIKQCMNMSVEDFSASWAELVSYCKNKPWYFFTNNKKRFSAQEHRPLLKLYCQEFNRFLELLVITQENKLELVQKKSVGMTTILQYWQKKRVTAVHHFYAFYFDLVAADFIEQINDTFLEQDSPDYTQRCQAVFNHIVQMSTLYRKLEKTEYDERYASYLQRYYELLSLLYREEKAKVVNE